MKINLIRGLIAPQIYLLKGDIMKKIKAYKILEHDYTCRGFKYEIGKTYKLTDEDENLLEPELCKRGFHACAKLEQCFDYYPPAGWNIFVEVELSGTIKGDAEDKYCSNIITIVKEIDIKDFIFILFRFWFNFELSRDV